MQGALMALLRGIERRVTNLWKFAEQIREDLDRIESGIRGGP